MEWRTPIRARICQNEAIELANAALGYVAPADDLQMIGDAHEVRGVVLSAAGRFDEARTALEEATANYERRGIVPRIARIRDRIAALAG